MGGAGALPFAAPGLLGTGGFGFGATGGLPRADAGLEPAGEPPVDAGGVDAPFSSAACARFAARIAASPPELPIPGMTETGAALSLPAREPRPMVDGTAGAVGGAAGAREAAFAATGAVGGARRTGAGAGFGAAFSTSLRYCRRGAKVSKESTRTAPRLRD